MVEAQGFLDPDVVEGPLGPQEVEALGLVARSADVADPRLDPLAEATRGRGHAQPLDARCVAVDGDDGPRAELGEVQGLPARAAAEIEHPRR